MGQPISKNVSSSKDDLETFSLLWLDAAINTTDDNRQAKKILQATIHQLKTFDNPDQCEQCIISTPVEDRIVLIVSGQLGRHIVPRVHHLEQLLLVYVYCTDKESNEKWACKYSKVIEKQ
jgi:hypothetical protein